MKALLALKSAINQSTLVGFLALACILPLAYPEIVMAAEIQTPGSQALVFNIKNPSLIENKNSNSLSFDEVVNSDPLVENLTAYLEKYNSPLSVYAAEIVKLPNWEKALAISFVESNMGIHCADNNCSGIGVAPGHPSWRKYATKLDWFKDLCALLDKPIYKEKYNTLEKMRGVYVVPGSDAWVNGSKKIYAELMILEKDAEEQRIALANSNMQIALSTFPELVDLSQ